MGNGIYDDMSGRRPRSGALAEEPPSSPGQEDGQTEPSQGGD